MENELLLNIADKLSKGLPMEIDKWDLENNQPFYGSGGVNEWQLERLKELGGLNEKNAKIIAKYSGKTQKEIEKVFKRAREIGTEVDKDILDLGIKAGILNEINPQLEDIIVTSILNNSIRNTLTTFNSMNNSLLASAGDNYRNIVNKVSSRVMAGTKTTAQAMQEAVSQLAEKGLTSFTARNGAEWTPEAYTKMVIRANTRNTINNIQDERMRLSGNDYVEISSHMGARPLCAEDQGKIFSLSGNTTPIEDGLGNKIKVYSWFNSSYGKPDGILGINCGHSRYAFVPGLSIHRKKEFTKKENNDAYIEKQKQRQYERNIRNKKREIEMLKKTNAESKYIQRKTNQLSDYQSQYLDFLKKTRRTKISSNEWLGSSSLSKSLGKKASSSYKNWTNRYEKEKKQEEIVKKSIIGTFNIPKYSTSLKTATKDVVLFKERINHIKGRHPEVAQYIKDIPTIIKNPDMVFKELKREDTIWIIKKINNNIKVTIKLNTSKDIKIKNSIIQMQIIRDKEIERYLKNGKIEELFDKNKKK